MPDVFAINEDPTNYVLMRENRSGSQVVTEQIFSKAEAVERAYLAQVEEDETYNGKPFLKWTYYAAELVPVVGG